MKHVIIAAALLFSGTALAQETNVEIESEKKKYSVSVGTDGIRTGKKESGKKEESRFELQYGMLDLGYNRIHNKGGNPAEPSPPFEPSDPRLLAIDGPALPLRESKSVNVNVYPLMMKYRLSPTKGANQNFYLTSGLGLQMYNFRFESTYNYVDQPEVELHDFSSLNLEKNKLGFTYLTVPLSLLAKTRVGSKWIVYGAGVMGGYRLATWTKLKTQGGDKHKNHDNFNFQDFNACLTAEIGVDDIIRLYGTYQLTPLHMDGTGLDQRPFAIGVRFLGL